MAVWDTESWQLRGTWVAVQAGAVDALAFTSDSRFLVSVGAGTSSICEVEQGESGGATIDVDTLRSGAPVSVATRDGGDRIVTATAETGVRLWSVAPQTLLEQACRVAGRDLSPAEWEQVLPDRPYERTCPDASG